MASPSALAAPLFTLPTDFCAIASQTNWRPLLRPLLERAVMERLWARGELGASNPHALLLSVWYIVSRQFGIGCRTQHVKLVLGNLGIATDQSTGQQQLQFFRTVPESRCSIYVDDNSPLPDRAVPAQPLLPERCPVNLFETFHSRRPFHVNLPISALYLQPERNTSVHTSTSDKLGKNPIWYSMNPMGKNKIGSMLHSALRSVHFPIGRHVHLTRFCDTLAMAALTPVGGPTGLRLAELLVNMKPQALESGEFTRELGVCINLIVEESTRCDSQIHSLLVKMCATNTTSVARNRSKAASALSRPSVVRSSYVPYTSRLHSTTTVASIVTTVAKQRTSHATKGCMSKGITETPTMSKIRPFSSQNNASDFIHNPDTNNQHLLTQVFQNTNNPNASHTLSDSAIQPVYCPAITVTTAPTVVLHHANPTKHVVTSGAVSATPAAVAAATIADVLVPSVSDTVQMLHNHSSPMDSISFPSTLQLDENLIDISRLSGFGHLTPFTVIPTPTKSSTEMEPMHENQSSNTPNRQKQTNSETSSFMSHEDDLRIDLRKPGGGVGRSVWLEVRELLDLVLAASNASLLNPPLVDTPSVGGTDGCCSGNRPPVGLVTQLLWRARALDDRGPWILTFAMWWLMQHYFGVGSRMHHVRLRWGHLRLVSGVRDPMTDEICEAIEYVGPAEFTTVKACALVESSGYSLYVRRVYPSSGWAEAEIRVASAFFLEDAASRPQIRPLDTTANVTPLAHRPGPNFVQLYKAFAQHRQQPSLLDDAPFYVQPLQSSALVLNCKPAIAWFSVAALGKNRIGALMRNIVDKVVRPTLPLIATMAIVEARKACIVAAQRAVTAVSAACPPNSVHQRQQAILNKLLCTLGLNSLKVLESTETQAVKSVNSGLNQSLLDAATSLQCSTHTCFTGTSSDAKGRAVTKEVNLDSTSQLMPRVSVAPVPRSVGHDCDAVGPLPSQPTASLFLLTSTDSNSTASMSCPSQQLLTQQPNSVILIPTNHGNAIFSGANLLQGVLGHPQTQAIVHPGHSSTLFTTTSGHASKTQIDSASQPIRTVAYLTHPNTSDTSRTAYPVNVIFLSTNNSQTIPALQPSIVLGMQTPVQQTQLNSLCDAVGTSSGINVSRQVAVDPSSRDQSNASLVDCHSTTVSPTTQTFAVTNRIQPTTTSIPCSGTIQEPIVPTGVQSVADNLSLYTHLFCDNGDGTSAELTYSQLRLKPEQISPTADPYEPSSIMLQAIAPGGSVIHISQPRQDECKPQLTYSQHDTRLVSSGATDVVTVYNQEHDPDHVVQLSKSTTLLDCGSEHGVLPSDPLTYYTVPHTTTFDTTTICTMDSLHTSCSTACPVTGASKSSGTPPLRRNRVINEDTKHNGMVDPFTRKGTGNTAHSVSLPDGLLTVCHRQCPADPSPDRLITLQAAIDSTRAFHCADFSGYVETLFRRGILSAYRPWSANFCAWFINSVVFEVENRTDHVNLRWGDFRLGQTADGKTEFLSFINRVTDKSYCVAAAPPSPYNLGLDEDMTKLLESDVLSITARSPCPVAVFKMLRDHRPLQCLESYSRFYLQPRSLADIESAKKSGQSPNVEWFTERPWGKNKLGGLFGEAAKMAGLPCIYLRKLRVRPLSPSGRHSLATTVEGVPSSTASGNSTATSSRHSAFSTVKTKTTGQRLLETKRRRLSCPSTQSTLSFTDSVNMITQAQSSGLIQLPSSSTILKHKSTSLTST